MNIANILTDELHHFIYELHQAGYNIGTAQFVQAQNLILSLAKQSRLPPIAQLETLLGPILCHSRQEQLEFGWRFDNWLKKIEESQRIRRTETIVSDAPQSLIPKWGIAILLLVSIVFVGSIFYYQSTPEIDTASEEKTISTIENSNQLPTTTPDSANVPADSTESSQPVSPNQPTELQRDIEKPEPKITLIDWILWIVLFILFLFLLGKVLWRRLAPLYLARKYTAALPDILENLPVKKFEKQIFQSQSIRISQTAQQLRKHIAIDSNDLDIMTTVKETIQAAGLFTPVYGTRLQRPEYLVLIDRTTFKDHQTGLIDVLVNKLETEEVFIDRYYFDSDLRRCYPKQDFLPPLTLTELAERYPGHRLLIFSDSNSLIHPLTGELVDWIDQLAIWPIRALLTLEALEQCEYQEELIKGANFFVLPANEIGLNFLVEQIDADNPQLCKKGVTENFSYDFPEFIRDYPRRWLEDYAPEPDELIELLTQVRLFLGKDGYYWFSACAVYPEILWELTLHLGDSLANDDKQTLLTEDNLTKLARLPWFRRSYMPNWLRERLVKDLLINKKDKEIRTAIETFLQPKPEEKSSKTQAKVVLEQPNPSLDTENPTKEYVFAMFMADKNELSTIALKPLEYMKLLVSHRLVPWFNQTIAKFNPLIQKFLKYPEWSTFGLVVFVSSLLFVSLEQPLSPIWFVAILAIAAIVIFGRKLFNSLKMLWITWTKNRYLYRQLVTNLIIGLTVYALVITFQDMPWLMDIQDSSMDFMMKVRQGIIPPISEKNIPPFVFLDIDNKTYQAWGEPMFTPRERLKTLVQTAVNAKARLVIVDIDVSQAAPTEGSLLHSEDQALKDYLHSYVIECRKKQEQSECPTIIFARAFRSKISNEMLVPRIGFLEEVITQGAPYLYWGSVNFYLSQDSVVRRWRLWQEACLDEKPQMIPSLQLLAMAIVKEDCVVEEMQIALKSFKPQSCNYKNIVPTHEMVNFCGLTFSNNIQDVNRQIMYSMPWMSESPSFIITQANENILIVLPALHYAETSSTVNLDILTDSIVIIGGSYTDGRDIHMTPIGYMPGALILINALHTLLEYEKIEQLSPILKILMVVVLISLMTILLAYFRSVWGILFAGIFIILILLPVSIVLFKYGIWLDFSIPLTVILIYHLLSQRVIISKD